ncbi:hypothetical protein OG271_12450 [Micromonospora rifamycinica]|uniref:hypothetical protein n=1 Tax=Micromonospora rifamycinica TaxID=291594 RepID=UPI002E2DEA15|nr:hypothetical protein [Micromonospora rifamycinica]
MGVYRSTNSQVWHRDEAAAIAACHVLDSHVPHPDNHLCLICLVPGPCQPANAAANRLVDLGRPVLPPDQPRRRAGWRGWFGPQRQGTPRQAPLLTFAWMLRLCAAATGPHSSVSS